MSWRKRSAAVLNALRPQLEGLDHEEQRKAISAAYPFGERAMHPYKVWLSECRVQFPHLYPAKQPPLPKWLTAQSAPSAFSGRDNAVVPAQERRCE